MAKAGTQLPMPCVTSGGVRAAWACGRCASAAASRCMLMVVLFLEAGARARVVRSRCARVGERARVLSEGMSVGTVPLGHPAGSHVLYL